MKWKGRYEQRECILICLLLDLYIKIDGLKIRGAGRRPEEGSRGHWAFMTNVNREKFARIKKFLLGGLKSFVKNLLFLVVLWFRQLFSDSCLYMLEFSRVWLFILTHCYLTCLLSQCNIHIMVDGCLYVVSWTILAQCREQKYQIILLYNSRV